MQRRFEWLAFVALIGVLVVGSGEAAAQAATVEARLRQLEGEAEIRRLLDDYMTLLDSRDWDAYVQLFAADGELDIARVRLRAQRGREAIAHAHGAMRPANGAAAAGWPRLKARTLENVLGGFSAAR